MATALYQHTDNVIVARVSVATMPRSSGRVTTAVRTDIDEEREWEAALSTPAFRALVAQARSRIGAGQTEPLDPESL